MRTFTSVRTPNKWYAHLFIFLSATKDTKMNTFVIKAISTTKEILVPKVKSIMGMLAKILIVAPINPRRVITLSGSGAFIGWSIILLFISTQILPPPPELQLNKNPPFGGLLFPTSSRPFSS